MKHIYCISGFGADEKMFSKFQFSDHEIHFIKWIIPDKNESIQHYAKRLTEQIHHEDPVLIGLSFGGIMCIEISKQVKTEFIIIISSVKTFKEMPCWMRISGKLKLNKIFPMKSFKLIEPIEDYNLGIRTKEEKEIVDNYRKNINFVYSDWAINEILNWKNNSEVQNLYHIHGDNDRIFSIKNVKANHVITGGGHLMVMHKSDEVNACINSILKNRM
ncbi:MAG: alpha/beta hydrolase [Bacteroidota bacterium]|nr:alpha/beta hydrolase [Bacteroidota bacterium]